jgi:hypothetical protein
LIISWVAVVVVSVAMTYVTKHLRSGRSDGAGEQTAMQARKVAWYFFGTIVSQGSNLFFNSISSLLISYKHTVIYFTPI